MAYVTYEKEGQLAMITLRRPERRNALGRELCRDLRAAYDQFEADTDVAVGILTGQGNFCAGRDIKETRWADGDEPHDAGFPSPDLFYYSRLTKPLIAAVNSYAFGGGMLLALAFPDLVICAESAVFELSEVQRSLLGAWELGWNLGVPRAAAMEIALGYRMSGRRAYELGLANAVVPDDELVDTAREWARQLLILPPAIIRRHRELLRLHSARPMSDQFLCPRLRRAERKELPWHRPARCLRRRPAGTGLNAALLQLAGRLCLHSWHAPRRCKFRARSAC
jgi:dehydration protein DpgD